jgi:Holliday junction resolvase RusA-like endonuclease
VTDVRTFAEIAARAVEPAKEPELPPAAKASSNAVVLRIGKPFSTNAMYRAFSRGGKGGLTTIKTKSYRDWQAQALGLISTQKWTPIEGAFGLQIKVPKDTRFDLDNCIKSTADILRAAGVIKDDSPKYMRRVEVLIGLANHTTITLKPMPLETTDAMD